MARSNVTPETKHDRMLAASGAARSPREPATSSAWRDPRSWRPYVVAIVAVAVALALRWLATPLLGDRYPFLFLFAAVLFAAWVGGLGPALLATNCGTVLHVIGAVNGERDDARLDGVATAAFLLLGIAISLLGAGLHRARERERAALAAYASEHALHRAHARTLDVLDTLTDGFIAVDRDGVVTYANAAAEHIARRPRGVLVGQPCGDAIPAFATSGVEAALRRVMSAGVSVTVDHRHPETGQWFQLKAHPAPEGGVSLHLRDVTANRERERELAESRRLLEQMTEGTPDILYRYDVLAERTVYVNRAIEELLGRSREDMQRATSRDWEAMVHPEDRATVRGALEHIAALADGEIWSYAYRMRHADGSYRWMRSRVTVFARTADGRVAEILGIAQDITFAREAEAVLARHGMP
jgi:PAS domain S-box-containing protein